ncbi:hypothetical protein QTN25_003822 [Entamoeba marina]
MSYVNLETSLNNILLSIKLCYIYYAKVQTEMLTIIKKYNFYPLVRYHPNGKQYASLNGSIPILYQGKHFLLPICLMFPFDYPLQPIFFFVDPTHDMEIVLNHPYVSSDCSIYHPIFLIKDNMMCSNTGTYVDDVYNNYIFDDGDGIHNQNCKYNGVNALLNKTCNNHGQQINKFQSSKPILPSIESIVSSHSSFENLLNDGNQTPQLTPPHSKELFNASTHSHNGYQMDCTQSGLLNHNDLSSSELIKPTLPKISEMHIFCQNNQELPPLRTRTSS